MNIDNIDIALDELKQFSLFVSQDLEIHDVESGILALVIKIGRLALEAHVKKRGTGNRGPKITLSDGETLSYIEDKRRKYLSIFGKVDINRAYYWQKGGGHSPLDKDMNLPECMTSYLLQEWGYGACTKDAYDHAQEVITQILGIRRPKRSIQNGIKKASLAADEFHDETLHQGIAPEGDVLAVEMDGKGIPMFKEKTTKGRLKQGEKRLKKKMAEIVTIQTINSEKLKEDRKADIKDTQSINKMAYGDLTNQEEFVEAIRDIADQRAEDAGIKMKVFLGDGQKSIWGIQERLFPSYVPILDWYHMSEYLWDAAHVLFSTKGDAAKKWVKKKERQLFNGKPGTVIRSIWRLRKEVKGKNKREKLRKCANYLSNNKNRMRYDLYIKQGLPIGTGSVEGTCKHLIINRMEGCGMRWKEEGAQAILKLRSVYINHLWPEFWTYYRNKQSGKLYSKIISIDSSAQREMKNAG